MRGVAEVAMAARRVTAVTAEEMRRLDKIAMEVTGPTLLQMMENAGRNLSTLLRRLIALSKVDAIVVLAGTGGNGGGAICAARHLANHGYRTALAISNREKLSEAAALQFKIYGHTHESDVSIEALSSIRPAVILDGLIGYGLRDAPSGSVEAMIQYANASGAPILSLDVPSGVDATTGRRPGIAIAPSWTMTLALPKTGLLHADCSDIYLADIGIPSGAFAMAGIEYACPFIDDYVISLDRAEE